MSAGLAGFGLDATDMKTDRIRTVLQVEGTLTSYLRFSQTGEGKWRIVLGATTLIGKTFSLMTVNLFLPPSQLLIHPFLRFYSTSPRSPALHYTIAKQVATFNLTHNRCSLEVGCTLDSRIYTSWIIFPSACRKRQLYLDLLFIFFFNKCPPY